MSRRVGSLASEVARFMDRCTRSGDCLMGPNAGYGEIRSIDGRMGAHRASFIVANGPIGPGLVVRHTCDRIGCIEPGHLILGTTAENNRDKLERNRPPSRRRSARTARAAA